MAKRELNIAIIGCGDIAEEYARTMRPYDHIKLVATTDLRPERSERLTLRHGDLPYPTIDDLLSESQAEVILNLTTHIAHAKITAKCLKAKRHVHSEKPLAVTFEEARQLANLAQYYGVQLSCSPATMLGEAQPTPRKIIRDGSGGAVRVAYAEANWGRIESWHPSPIPFFAVGALFDVGVYPLTILTTILGPVRKVQAYGSVPRPNRLTNYGVPFQITTPDWTVAIMEMANGTAVRLTCSFYVPRQSHQRGIEFHGDAASLHLVSWQDFDANVRLAPFGRPYSSVALLKEPYAGTEWARSVLELSDALAEGRPTRTGGAQAAHIGDVLAGVMTSINEHRLVELRSDFLLPPPLAWAA